MQIKSKLRVEFTLPWPPSVNQMYCRNKKKVYLAPKARKFYEDCKWYLLKQFNCRLPKFENKVKMFIEFFPRRNGGWDASNHFKALEDAIVKIGMIKDDQVKYLIPQEPVIHQAVKEAYVKIILEEIE